MTDADKLFNETWARWLYAGSVISNFRNTFTAVAPVASEHLEVVNTAFVRSLFEDPQFEGFVVDAEPGKIVSTTPDYEELGRKAASKVFESSYASPDVAVLVFYHSLLDGLAFRTHANRRTLTPKTYVSNR